MAWKAGGLITTVVVLSVAEAKEPSTTFSVKPTVALVVLVMPLLVGTKIAASSAVVTEAAVPLIT